MSRRQLVWPPPIAHGPDFTIEQCAPIVAKDLPDGNSRGIDNLAATILAVSNNEVTNADAYRMAGEYCKEHGVPVVRLSLLGALIAYLTIVCNLVFVVGCILLLVSPILFGPKSSVFHYYLAHKGAFIITFASTMFATGTLMPNLQRYWWRRSFKEKLAKSWEL